MHKCQVKGCDNVATFSYITHDEDDHEICRECANKYLSPTHIKHGPGLSAVIEDKLSTLRQKVNTAQEARRLGQDDLYQYSIDSAEDLVSELIFLTVTLGETDND